MNAHFKLFAFVFLALALWPSVATAQTGFACSTILNGSFYNLTSLMGTQITGSSASGDNNYYLSLCGVAPFCKKDGSMACQAAPGQSSEGLYVYDVAYSNDDIAQHYWSLVPGGVQLTAFGSRIYCTNFGDERIGKFTIYCDPTVTGPVTAFTGPIVESPTCTYNFYINHTSGCPLAIPVTPTPTPTTLPCTSASASSTDQSTVTGAGFGVGVAVGIVLCAATTFAYVCLTGRGKRRWNAMEEDNKGLKMGHLGSGTSSDDTTA